MKQVFYHHKISYQYVSLTHSDFFYFFSVLNIGTSCQLAVVVPDRESPNLVKHVTTEALQLLPFFKGRKVITAASLSGTDCVLPDLTTS